MSERTIPEPTAEDRDTARTALANTFKHHRVLANLALVSASHDIVEIHAQMAAEIRWLRNMVHPK